MTETDPGALDVIIVGTDGSSDAHHAVEWAGRLARRLDAMVVLTHAVGLLERLPGEGIQVATEVRSQVQDLLEGEWREPLVALGVRHRVVLEDGPARMVLPRVAERESAGFIVVASHGRGEAPAALLGSTSHAVAEAAAVPVLIVPGARRRAG
jgi:nucleotide-binding universal stress UspA family protein